MDLYFLRHGEADWPNWKKSDDERPLTKHGKKEMHEVAKFLKRVKARPDLIITSPFPRASQTAEIAAEHLKVKCHEDKLIAPGFGRQELERVLKKYPAESLMVVGHEPDFTHTISQLTGASLKLSKAGVALVALDRSWRNGTAIRKQLIAHVGSGSNERRFNVWLYQISTKSLTLVPNPRDKVHSAAAVNPFGTVYFEESGSACGSNATVEVYPIGGPMITAGTLRPGIDMFHPFLFEHGSTDSFQFAKLHCAGGATDVFESNFA